MEKLEKEVYITELGQTDVLDGSIDEIIEAWEKISQIYKRDYVRLVVRPDWDYTNLTLNLFGIRLETDKEFEVRMVRKDHNDKRRAQKKVEKKALAQEALLAQEESDFAKYQELKKRFEK